MIIGILFGLFLTGVGNYISIKLLTKRMILCDEQLSVEIDSLAKAIEFVDRKLETYKELNEEDKEND